MQQAEAKVRLPAENEQITSIMSKFRGALLPHCSFLSGYAPGVGSDSQISKAQNITLSPRARP